MKNAGVWAGLITFIIGGIFFWGSFSLPYTSPVGPGPGLFPRWLSGILMCISPLYIWESIAKDPILISDVLPARREFRSIIGIVIAPILFMLMVSFTGFVIAGTMLVGMLLLREYKWYWSLAIALVTSVSTFVLFQVLLDVPLPVNVFGW